MSIDIHFHPTTQKARLVLEAKAMDTASAPLWIVIRDTEGRYIGELMLHLNNFGVAEVLAVQINELFEPEHEELNAKADEEADRYQADIDDSTPY